GMTREVFQFSHLLDALACGAALVERSGRIVHVNPRAAAMMGRDADHLVGRAMQSLYPEEAQAFIAAALADLDAPREGEFYLPTASGGRVPVVISGRSWRDSSGARSYYALTMTDITSLKEAEDDLKNQY